MAAILMVASENDSGFAGYGTYFCHFETMRLLHKLFHLPSCPDAVWITLHTRKSLNRVPVRVVRYNNYPAIRYNNYPAIKIPLHPAVVSKEGFDAILEPHIGKTLWLQVEYSD